MKEDAPKPAGRPSSLVDTRVIYCGDCLDQLRKLPDACVDLIYIDPPFNSNRNYEVFWGETKEKRAFEDRHGRCGRAKWHKKWQSPFWVSSGKSEKRAVRSSPSGLGLAPLRCAGRVLTAGSVIVGPKRGAERPGAIAGQLPLRESR